MGTCFDKLQSCQKRIPSLLAWLQFVKTRSHRPLQFTSNGNVFWQIVNMPKPMGTCFGDGNVFWQIQTDENATGTHLQERIFRAFKSLLWPWRGMYKIGEVPRIPKIPLTHFWPNATGTGFDKLVLIWTVSLCGTRISFWLEANFNPDTYLYPIFKWIWFETVQNNVVVVAKNSNLTDIFQDLDLKHQTQSMWKTAPLWIV